MRTAAPTIMFASDLAPLLDNHRSSERWRTCLSDGAFEPAEEIACMELVGGVSDEAHENADVKIVMVHDDREPAEFASVQSAAFLQETDPADGCWRECFTAMALGNYASRGAALLYWQAGAGARRCYSCRKDGRSFGYLRGRNPLPGVSPPSGGKSK
jgi:hypothetical protein